MFMEIRYLGVIVKIYTDSERILINDNINSDELFNMVFNSILNKIDIDINNYYVVRNKVEG